MDIGFILDSSGSLKSEYQKEKDFVKALAEKFELGEDQSHAGVIAFSARAEHSIKMSDHPNSKVAYFPALRCMYLCTEPR